MAGITANSVSVTMASGDTAVDQAVAGYLSGETITLATSPTGSTYSWGIAIPSGSATGRVALSDATAAAPSFRPDVAGDYLVPCTVDSTTTYVIRISVVQASVTTSLEAIRYAPVTAASVTAPAQGVATFYDVDQGRLRAKASDASYVETVPRLGTFTLSSGGATIADTSVTTSTVVAVSCTTASNRGTLTYTFTAGVGVAVASSDASDASTYRYALIG